MNTNSLNTRLAVSRASTGEADLARSSHFAELAMLWTKGWLETRLILWYVVGGFALNLGAEFMNAARGGWNAGDMLSRLTLIWILAAVMLAGNGIRTPARFRASAGTHTSMYYTLSLPVSRFRLFSVRVAIGALELIAFDVIEILVMCSIFPVLRANSKDVVFYFVTLLAYTLAFYSLSVLLAALLEGPWRVWGTVFIVIGIRWLVVHALHSVDVLDGIAGGAPLLTHKLSSVAIAALFGLTALFLAAASKAVVSKEY